MAVSMGIVEWLISGILLVIGVAYGIGRRIGWRQGYALGMAAGCLKAREQLLVRLDRPYVGVGEEDFDGVLPNSRKRRWEEA